MRSYQPDDDRFPNTSKGRPDLFRIVADPIIFAAGFSKKKGF
jgi:hypothetical protein